MKKTLITLIALAGIAHADFIWNGGESITQELWQTESSWTVTGSDSWPSAGTGPGTPNSNAWSLISVSGASGSITQLEGLDIEACPAKRCGFDCRERKKIPRRLFY